jgi:hypothetical protein
MSKQEIIKIGDRIKIVNPQMFIRCGYPLDLQELTKEISIKYYEEIKAFVDKIVFPEEKRTKNSLFALGIRLKEKEREFEDIARHLAYRIIAKKKFGGNERTIYTKERVDLKGKEFLVVNTKTVVTGTYFPPSGDRDEFESGGLTHMKQHKILSLSPRRYRKEELLRIEVCHVKKL